MEIYVKISFISIFVFFWFSNMIISDALILPVSQLQTQQVMTSQIRSHIEYLIQTNYILLLISYSKLTKNLALMTVLNTI